MDDNTLPDFGELLFSLVIGYIGALEFFYVVRHLYHWSCNHPTDNEGDGLKRLQDDVLGELGTAEANELRGGGDGVKAMQDGVLYKDGFRIDPQQAEIDRLLQQRDAIGMKDARRKKIEAELIKQKQIEEDTRKQLERAEAELMRQRKESEEAEQQKQVEEDAEEAKKLLEAERAHEEEQRKREEEIEAEERRSRKEEEEENRQRQKEEVERLEKEEAEEEAQRLKEEDRQRKEQEAAAEEEGRRREAEELAENERKLIEAEKQREEEQRLKELEEREAAENEARLLEAEKQREEEQRLKELEEREAAENERRLLEAEEQRKEEQRLKEFKEKEAAENERKLLEAEKQREEEKLLKELEEREIVENERKLLEAEKQREEEQRLKELEEEEAAETEKGLLEAEKHREEEKRLRELEEMEISENERRLLEAEKQREEDQRLKELEEKEAAETEKRLLEAEKQREEEPHLKELEEREAVENDRKQEEKQKEEEQSLKELKETEAAEKKRELKEIEDQQKEEKHLMEFEEKETAESERETKELEEREAAENERKLIEAEKLREEDQRLKELEESEIVENEEEEAEKQRIMDAEALLEIERRIIEAEQSHKVDEESVEQTARNLETERARERRQKSIEENARLFLEAEQEMVELQERMMEVVQQRQLSTTESAPPTPIIEEPCIKKIIQPHTSSPSEPEYECEQEQELERPILTVKTQFGQAADEPYSLTSKPLLFPSLSDDASSVEPQSSISAQHSEEFLTGQESINQSIDMQIPQQQRQEPEGEDNDSTNLQYTDEYLRSLDGIKARPLMREDGSRRRRAFKKRRSSGSSNSSHDSRASREEELKMFTSLEEEELQMKKEGESEYTPIKYTNEPQTLKVKNHRRRHKRSPAKDTKSGENSVRSSLEMLNEEQTNPWGEGMPEHYKQTAFWKREKATSIDEENELERPHSAHGKREESATNVPKTSSFEEATDVQNQEALSALKQLSKEGEKDDETKTIKDDHPKEDTKQNLIFSGEYTKAMDKDWHSSHFCCWQCDESLTGQRYVIRDDHPYCIKCYENVFANTCEECNKIIGIDSKDLSYKDKHWHEACFLCFKCHLSLVDKQFGAKADKIYCGTCYDAQFASRCDGCGEVFRAGTKKMEYKTRQWHENCFCCCVCKMAIGTKSFIPREQEIYCAGCYEEKFATRCIKCNKVITSGGVTYKNEPWHRECFTCTHCNITLAGQRFTSRDEKPYCAECFGELFAKRCTACVKPITGIGGTRFISFEDRHWHHDCFVCASCKTSLVGRGFITDGPDIICPECAKQRLM